MRSRERIIVLLKTQVLWARLDTLGRSQNWLARELGISRGYLSTLVNEGRAPSGRIRRRMLEILGVEDFHELFALERNVDRS
ncbi:MAG: helix-turn-helix transcriptional regulator [Chloroflexota bacterium]|nr:helix-turn-helix transcriptional regulator [Chloroflexota bacterium]